MKGKLSRKRVTLADVAALAGVSPSAVSVALSKRSSTTILRPETRERIVSAARSLNYQPDIRAKGLVGSRSFLVALLARQAFDRWVVGISRGIEHEIRDRSYSLLSYSYGDHVRDERGHIRLSLDRKVDGLIVMPALDPNGQTNADQFHALQNEGLPIVQLFGKVLPGIPSVFRDHAQGTRLAVQHLLELGHRRIVHLTHARATADRDPINAHLDARTIRETYEREIVDAGLQPHVVTHAVPAGGGVRFAPEAEAMADQILGMPERPTAVLAYSDYQALGLMRGLQVRGLRIPDDISIVGSDNEDASSVTFPTLTTVHYSQVALGREAARLLLRQMDGEPVTDAVVGPELCLRESTAAPPDQG